MIYHVSVTLRVPDEDVANSDQEVWLTRMLVEGVKKSVKDTFAICGIKHGEVEPPTVEGG